MLLRAACAVLGGTACARLDVDMRDVSRLGKFSPTAVHGDARHHLGAGFGHDARKKAVHLAVLPENYTPIGGTET